jgi:hypothetical protein
MKIYIVIIVVLAYNSIAFTQKKSNTFIENPMRLEIYKSPYSSIRLFEDGMLCKTETLSDSLNGLYTVIFKFYPLRDLNYKTFAKLQLFLSENDIINYPSRIEDENLKVSGYIPIFYITKQNKINEIVWWSGKNKTLEEIINLTNELIPKEDRETFKIRFKTFDK